MRIPVLKLTSFLLFFGFIVISCDTEDPFRIPEPDFSTVPQPFEYEEVQPVEIEEGVDAYILDEGTGTATVELRDQISVFLTVRAGDDIIYSTSANNNPTPDNLFVSDIPQRNTYTGPYHVKELAYSAGLKSGILGMKEGERRTLIVSPDKGFGNVSETNRNYQYRDATLQYDIVLSRISY